MPSDAGSWDASWAPILAGNALKWKDGEAIKNYEVLLRVRVSAGEPSCRECVCVCVCVCVRV
jgi:hypothetical protein